MAGAGTPEPGGVGPRHGRWRIVHPDGSVEEGRRVRGLLHGERPLRQAGGLRCGGGRTSPKSRDQGTINLREDALASRILRARAGVMAGASVTPVVGVMAGVAAPFPGAACGMDLLAAPRFVLVALHGEEREHASDAALLTGFCLSAVTWPVPGPRRPSRLTPAAPPAKGGRPGGSGDGRAVRSG